MAEGEMMSNSAPPWFRFYNETISDLKIQRVADLSDQQKALVIGVWAAILAMASESPERGQLLISEGLPLTLREIMRHAGVDQEPGKAIITAMVEVGMIYLDGDTYTVTNWDKRQFASDSSKERVKQYRERQKQSTKPSGEEPEPIPQGTPESNGSGNAAPVDGADYVKRYSNVTVTAQESESESTPNGVTENPVAATDQSSRTKRDVDKDELTADSLRQAGTALKLVMATFLDKSNIPKMPGKKNDQKFWWSEIRELFTIADSDTAKAQLLVELAVDELRKGNLTINTPKSIVPTARRLAGNLTNNGQKIIASY